MSDRTPVGVLVSGAGTNLDALLQASRAPEFPGRIALVVSNRRSAHALDVASGWGVPSLALPQSDFGGNATARDREIRARFEAEDVKFHQDLREAYRQIAASEPERCVLIDATPDPATVAANVWAALRDRLLAAPANAANSA